MSKIKETTKALAESNKVHGFYISEWDGGIEIVSEAIIDLDTKEVEIGKHFYDYDFDQIDLEVLDREYVTINNVEYPCCRKNDAKEYHFWYK